MKIQNYILIIMLVAGSLFACSDDEKGPVINPAAENGSLTFVLNQTQYADFVYVLEEGKNGLNMDALTCSQPDYGFTAAVTYSVEVSFNENMSGAVQLASSVQGENISINVKEMNKAIFDLYEGEMPNPSVAREVHVRLKAVVSTATKTPLVSEPTVKPIYSNAVTLKILPYYIENLKRYHEAEELKPYYIIGYMGWDNNTGGLGKHVIPMSVVEDPVYNSDGQGIYEYTGYLEASKTFKIIGTVGGWSEQWGNADADGIDNIVHNDGGSADFQVPEDGYYTITLNSIANKLSFEKKSIAPKVYDNMGLVGEMTDWGESPDIPMIPYQVVNNHVWYAEYTFAGDGQFKFRYNSDWGTNWGTSSDSDGDPAYSSAGVGKPGGKNLFVRAGTYVIVFNDIDSSYTLIRK